MFVTTVLVSVKPEYSRAFIEATTSNHRASILEEGNCRFDVLQSQDDPDSFLLYEAYQTKEHAAAHKETAHYARWKSTVEPYMALPRKGIVYTSMCP